jgi:hypothetical protein
MAIEPTDFVRKYAPWSTSKADTVRNCPLKFKYQYIDKIRGLKAPREEDALVGKAMHKLLEYAISLNRPAEPFIGNVLAEFGLEGDLADRFLALIPSAESLLVRLEDYRTRRWGGPTPKIEQKIAVTLEGKPVAFFDDSKAFFRGVLDLSYRIPSKPHIVLLDHKTGKDRGISYYQSQFDGYLWLIKGLYPELEGAQIAVNFLQTNKTEFSPFTRFSNAGELCERVVAFLNKATAKAENLEAAKPGPLCPWCNFHSICPAHATDGTHGKENHNEDGKGVNPQ